jgi:hypothetical protein
LPEGARDERLQSYLLGISVDLDSQAEGLVDGVAQLRIGLGERLGEVGQRVEDSAGFLDVDRLLLLGLGELRESGLDLLAL